MMTAGVEPYRETVALAAHRAGLQTGTGHPAEAEQAHYAPIATDNRERRSRAAIQGHKDRDGSWRPLDCRVTTLLAVTEA